MVIGDLPTKHTKYTKLLPDRQSHSGRAPGGDAGDAAGPKGVPFGRRPLPRPTGRFAAAGFACLAAIHASNGKVGRGFFVYFVCFVCFVGKSFKAS